MGFCWVACRLASKSFDRKFRQDWTVEWEKQITLIQVRANSMIEAEKANRFWGSVNGNSWHQVRKAERRIGLWCVVGNLVSFLAIIWTSCTAAAVEVKITYNLLKRPNGAWKFIAGERERESTQEPAFLVALVSVSSLSIGNSSSKLISMESASAVR